MNAFCVRVCVCVFRKVCVCVFERCVCVCVCASVTLGLLAQNGFGFCDAHVMTTSKPEEYFACVLKRLCSAYETVKAYSDKGKGEGERVDAARKRLAPILPLVAEMLVMQGMHILEKDRSGFSFHVHDAHYVSRAFPKNDCGTCYR